VPPPTTIETPVFLEAAADAPAAIGANWNPRRISRSRPGFNSLAVASLGIAIVLVSWLTLSALASIISFFGVSLVLGSIALALYVGGSGVLLYAVVREWRSLRELHQVDALRVALAASVADVGPAREMCKAWLLRLSPHQPAAMTLAAALDEVTDTSQMRAMIRSRLAGSLDTATRRIGIRAASEGSALVALSPHHSWDGVIVGLHGLRVIRQVAEAHALRPGPAVMLALIGRVARAAVETVATDLLSQTAADQLLGSVPVLKHLAAAIPGISVAGLRLYRLAATVARVCSPVVD
jgi:putative membrane protein